MPRPSTKKQLIELAEQEFAALENQISALPPLESLPASTPENWTPVDFAAHLWEWQHMLFGWYEAGCRGENPPTPAPGYKWNQLPALNLVIYHKHQNRTLKEVMADLRESHRRLLELVRELPEEVLFTTGRFTWTRTNTLGAYIVSAGSSHYLWARKEIQRSLKN
ncbi:MAG: ClbS/DfsB family four-helix bundle protein [Anaerolineaceae bacterium]